MSINLDLYGLKRLFDGQAQLLAQLKKKFSMFSMPFGSQQAGTINNLFIKLKPETVSSIDLQSVQNRSWFVKCKLMQLSNYSQGRDNNFNRLRIVAAFTVLATHSSALAIGAAATSPELKIFLLYKKIACIWPNKYINWEALKRVCYA